MSSAEAVPSGRGTKTRALLALTLIAISLLVGLGLSEIALRITGFPPSRPVGKRLVSDPTRPDRFLHCYPSNPTGELGPAPRLDGRGWVVTDFVTGARVGGPETLAATPFCVEYKFSSDRLRDDELSDRPERGRRRIVLAGDSFAFGEGVPASLTLDKHLERELGPNLQVINGGASGLRTSDELGIVSSLCERFAAPFAIVVFVPNDVSLSPALEERERALHRLSSPTALEHHSPFKTLALLERIRWAQELTDDTIAWYSDAYDAKVNPVGLESLRSSFERLREQRCGVSLVIFPLLERLDAYPFAEIHREVTRLATKAGLPVLDLLPAFEGLPTKSLWAHPLDHHPNGRAHAIAAKAIASWVHGRAP
ncbi:MAG: hypothetical protein HYV07_03130 [Deltaproteobacteria bacterium]|nr:hypothetical protein [Deltaproteobacteria bacterium]